MNKQKLLTILNDEISQLQKTFSCIEKLEPRRTYRIHELLRRDGTSIDTIGVLETFNRLSIRFRILASDNEGYTDEAKVIKSVRVDEGNSLYHYEAVTSMVPANFNSFLTNSLYRCIEPFTWKDVTTCVGMKYISKELAEVLKTGKTKIKFF